MIIIANGQKYTGTPEQIVEQLKDLMWDAESCPDAENYIERMKQTYYRMTGTDMPLPEGTDTRARIRAMFMALGSKKIIEVVEAD